MEGLEKLDIISKLPPEVVLHVTRYLSVSDFLTCCRICSYWHSLFTSDCMNPFWKRANEAAGFKGDYYRSRGIPDNALLREISKHRKRICELKPEVKCMVGRYPFESTMKCEYAGKGYFVKTIDYHTLEAVETVIGKWCPVERAVKKVDTMVGDHGSVSIATVIGEDVVWMTKTDRWFKYNTTDCTYHSMFDTKDVYCAGRSGDAMGHCRHCMFFVIADIDNSRHGYSWVITLIRVDEDGSYESPCRLRTVFPIPPGITQYIPRPVTAYLVPEDANCSSHQLIIQGGTGACVFKVTHCESASEGEIKLSPKPIGTLNPFFDSDIAVMVVDTTSKMTLSLDEKLIGMVTSVVYPFKSGLYLHIFDLETYKRIVSVRVDWTELFKDTEVLSVSRLYTVLGVGHSKGVIKIINSSNGNVVLTHSELSRGLPPVIPLAKLLFVHYKGVYDDECLTDICSPFTLTIVYRKGAGNLEALCFHPFNKKGKSESTLIMEKESDDDDDDDDI